jgi:cytochrome c oxidase subunit 2
MNGVLRPAGPDAALIAELGWVMTLAGAAIFIGVMLVVLAGVRRGRRALRPRRWLVGAGVVFPGVVLAALLGFSTLRSLELAPRSSLDALHIGVTGHLWWWEVRYHDPSTGRSFVSANEIHIPTGRKVYLGLSSADVIHSLWVPQLAGKMDMLPGRTTALVLQADRPGVYRGQCAEFCGQQHARMALVVVAHSPTDFAAWLRREASQAAAPSGPLATLGRQAFLDARCGACHAVRGVTHGGRGPDLTHVGSRQSLGAGTLGNSRAALTGWIADPQTHKPGALMPSSRQLDRAGLAAVAAYLDQLK